MCGHVCITMVCACAVIPRLMWVKIVNYVHVRVWVITVYYTPPLHTLYMCASVCMCGCVCMCGRAVGGRAVGGWEYAHDTDIQPLF